MAFGSVTGRQDAIASFARKLREVAPRVPRIPRLSIMAVRSGNISLYLFISLQSQSLHTKICRLLTLEVFAAKAKTTTPRRLTTSSMEKKQFGRKLTT